MMMQQQSQVQMQAQMQQQRQFQQFQTMQQQFQQSMQNQIAAMDQRANKTDKILRRLVKKRYGKKKQRHDERDARERIDSDGASSSSSCDS